MSKGIITVWGKVSQLNFNLIDCRLAACYLYQIVIGAKWLIVVIDGSRGMHVIWARMLNQFHNLNLNPLQSRNRLALHSVYTEGVYIAIWIWLMGILIRFENLLRINCTWSMPAPSSVQQSNCPIDYRLTILGIEFDFRFRFEFGFGFGMWNEAGRGTSNHMLKISHVANVVYAFQWGRTWGNLQGATRATQSIATSWGKCVIKQSDPPKSGKKAQLLLDVPSPLRMWWAQRIKYAWARQRARHSKRERDRERGSVRVGQWYAHIINTLLGLWINI